MKQTSKLSLLIFLVGVGAAIVGFSLIKEDIMSTAYTMLDYFPIQFGVKPVIDITGGILVGLFFSLTQMAGLFAAMTDDFSPKIRVTGFMLFIVFMLADNYTDIAYRSQYFTGNLMISMAVTGTIYTLGSEFSSAIASAIIAKYWRNALGDFMMGFAVLKNKAGMIGREWNRYDRAAKRNESKWLDERVDENGSFRGVNGSKDNPNKNYQGNNNQTRNQAYPLDRKPIGSPVMQAKTNIPQRPSYPASKPSLPNNYYERGNLPSAFEKDSEEE